MNFFRVDGIIQKCMQTTRPLSDPVTATANECAVLFKALGHPVRIEIIKLLAHTSYRVDELAQHTHERMSNVSKHLGVLRNAGLVTSERKGSSVHYSLACSNVLTLLHDAQLFRGKRKQQSKNAF